MNIDDRPSTGSMSSGGERGPASPPYHAAQQHLPPYQSQETYSDDSTGSKDKGKQRSPPESVSSNADAHGLLPDPRVAMPMQGPRVASRDPLGTAATQRAGRPLDAGHTNSGSQLRGNSPPVLKIDAPSGEPIRPTFSRRNSDASTITDGGEDFFDEFDWSEDEQEQNEAREEQKQLQAIALRRRKISPFAVIRWLCTTFLGNFLISAALTAPVIVLQYVYRDKGPVEGRHHRDYVADNVQAWFIWAAFNLHMEWWIHFLVEIFPRIAMGGVVLVWGNASQDVKNFVELFNAIKNYLKLVFYAALSWGSWAIIFNTIYKLYTRTHPETESRALYLYRIYQVIEFFFFFILTICAEKIILKIISIRFHKTAYSERIARITKALQTFDHLKDHRPKLAEKSSVSPFNFRTPRGGRTPAGPRTPHGNFVAPVDFAVAAEEAAAQKMESGDATPKPGFFSRKTHATKRPADPTAATPSPARSVREYADAHTPGAASARSTRSGRAMSKAKAKASQASTLARRAMVDPTNLLTDETVGVGLDVNSPAEARRLARTLFRAYRGRHRRNYLIPEDFEVAYPTPEQAKDAFEVFDTDRNGDISMTEMKNTIVEVYKDRRFVAKSLEDTSSALGQLDFILLFIAMIIVAFEAFAIFNVDISKTLTTFYTLAIGASFIFKESAQEIFDSIIFIFVTHPFDTGDRICVDGQVMVVQKMSLLSSQFLLWDNTQIFINNAFLSQMFIMNYRRSGYQWECVTMQVAFNTPLSALDAVQEDLIHWLQTEPDRMFEPSTAIVPQTIDYLRSITVTIGMTHRANYQDWGARWFRRNCFFAACCYYMRKHGVKYVNSMQPIVYSDPPSYETSEAQRPEDDLLSPTSADTEMGDSGPGSSRHRPSMTASTDDSDVDDAASRSDAEPLLNDHFAAATGTTTPHSKAKTFMGFAPPPDELEGTMLRRRKARRNNASMAQQGGDS